MPNLKLSVQAKGKTREVTLQPGLTRIGAAGERGVDVGVDGAEGELHVWDSPPKVVRVQGDDALVVSGDAVEEALLEDGQKFAWCGVKFQLIVPAAVLEEIVEEPPAPKPVAKTAATSAAARPKGQGATRSVPSTGAPSTGAPSTGAPSPSGAGAPAAAAAGLTGDARKAFDRLAAGLLVETNLADKKVAKRWQNAVIQHEWDADACARDILAVSGDAMSNPKFVERAGRLERDLVMASFQRGIKGASRRARGAARNTSAFIITNVIAFLVYTAIILALLVLARVNYDWDLNGIIDRAIGGLTPGLIVNLIL